MRPRVTSRDPQPVRSPPPRRLADPGTFPPLDPHAPPWPGREVTSGGVTLHVRETPGPDGCRAVYVHGLGGSALNWTDLAALLGTRAAGATVDLPGFGRSRPPAGFDFTPAAHADALLCFLAGRNEPVHLLGNSLGGAIAISVAARRPELVRTLTLVSPAMPDRRPDPRRMADVRLALALVPGRIGDRARAGSPPRRRACRPSRWSGCASATRRGARAPARRGRRGDRRRGGLAWAQEAGERTARGLVASWWWGRVAMGGGRAGAGADPRRVGRPRPARLAAPGRAHRGRDPRGAAAHAARHRARRPDRGGPTGGPGRRRAVGRRSRRRRAVG